MDDSYIILQHDWQRARLVTSKYQWIVNLNLFCGISLSPLEWKLHMDGTQPHEWKTWFRVFQNIFNSIILCCINVCVLSCLIWIYLVKHYQTTPTGQLVKIPFFIKILWKDFQLGWHRRLVVLWKSLTLPHHSPRFKSRVGRGRLNLFIPQVGRYIEDQACLGD